MTRLFIHLLAALAVAFAAGAIDVGADAPRFACDGHGCCCDARGSCFEICCCFDDSISTIERVAGALGAGACERTSERLGLPTTPAQPRTSSSKAFAVASARSTPAVAAPPRSRASRRACAAGRSRPRPAVPPPRWA